MHLKPGTSAYRAQKRRLQYLEQILHTLRSGNSVPPDFNPGELLNCSYLRLTHSNVETLENAMREAGKDPGIHAHSKIENIELWDKNDKKASGSSKGVQEGSKPVRKPDAKAKLKSQPSSRKMPLR